MRKSNRGTRMTDEWKSITDASRDLRVSYHVIKRLVDEGRVQTKRGLIDKRKVYVNVNQLREVLAGSEGEGTDESADR